MPSEVDANYHVTIDPEVRERLGVKPGSDAVQTIVDNRLEIVFLPPEQEDSLAGSLAKYADGKPQITDWQTMKREAWEAHVDERWGPPQLTE